MVDRSYLQGTRMVIHEVMYPLFSDPLRINLLNMVGIITLDDTIATVLEPNKNYLEGSNIVGRIGIRFGRQVES